MIRIPLPNLYLLVGFFKAAVVGVGGILFLFAGKKKGVNSRLGTGSFGTAVPRCSREPVLSGSWAVLSGGMVVVG